MKILIKNKDVLKLSKLIKENRFIEFKDSELKVGVDLGTANIVLVVTDMKNNPIAGLIEPAKVVRDGIVVDYMGAIKIVRDLKEKLERLINKELVYAACAIPPGIDPRSVKSISNVVESADFVVTNIVDEPTAAAKTLKIKDGAIVDLGGGTTGISLLKNGKVVGTWDEPTGGHHMNLTIAGYYNIDIDEAEKLKINSNNREIFTIIKPVLEKMASIVKNVLDDKDVKDLYLVGGASNFNGIEDLFEKITGIKTYRSEEALLVTPLGISKSCIGGKYGKQHD
ncbi:MAG: ethanolamine utilization protein EutJ [Peptoniphilus grossensis]|uniref:ethanolamine utilization protein EutJ n=1 Tax=Peptoniphilus grossensis TaxID=1465756 RepID=UPI00290D81D8|nr:ethanolamine utilization protein EutJ [Peptoniphilus grossensis]MDU7150784.1 ethanolamine utilization protein EutJ [Peptoniphilus grossensis]